MNEALETYAVKDEALEAYAFQALRAPLVPEWLDSLGLGPGDSVIDLGCGAGYNTIRLAERVGRNGSVVAVDSSPPHTALLRSLVNLHGIGQIQIIEGSVETAELPLWQPRGVLLTFLLHHIEAPAELLRGLAHRLPGVPLLVADFDPQGPCNVGPPTSQRIGPGEVVGWAGAAGYATENLHRQSPEHWFTVLTSH